jgi:hypothetical protein
MELGAAVERGEVSAEGAVFSYRAKLAEVLDLPYLPDELRLPLVELKQKVDAIKLSEPS